MECDFALKYLVKIITNDNKIMSSGVIVKLEEFPSNFFVFTSKHTFEDYNKNLQIEKNNFSIYYEDKALSYKSYVFLDEDIVVFIFDNSMDAIKSLDRVSISTKIDNFENCFFSGYANGERYSLCEPCTYLQKLELKNNLFQIIPKRDIDSFNIDGLINPKGFSGSGLFIENDKSLVGIIIEHETNKRAYNYIALAPLKNEIIEKIKNRYRKYNYIKEKFEELKRRVRIDNKNGLYDIHKILEKISLKLLNDVYQWNLEHTNRGRDNHFDLIDYKNKILVEVKSTINAQVLKKYINYNSNEYSGYKLIMFSLNDKQLTRITLNELSLLNITLWDFSDILKKIEENEELINKVYKTLRDFFSTNRWHVIYSKFAKCLYEFYDKNQNNSGNELYRIYLEKDSEFDILPWVKHFDEHEVTSLDPIHIFASFTYWNIRVETRKKKMLFFCEIFEQYEIDVSELKRDIENSTVESFRYFPHPNITYIVSARNHQTQQEVWEFFGLIYQNIDNERLEYLYSHINANWYGVKIEFATIFMFWIDSEKFIALDNNTFTYLKEKYKLNKLPMEYSEYKKLIEGVNEFLFLYRNIVKIADNRSFVNELIEVDKLDYDRFFNIQIIDNFFKIIDNVTSQEENDEKLDIDRVENFEFEFYFVVGGKAKKIVHKENQHEIHDLTLENPKNIDYPNFQIVAIKVLNEEYTKVLESNELYYFTKNIEILEDKHSMSISENTNNIYSKDYGVKNINITAIVGKNGTGKSTIIDLLIMAFNNIAKSFDDTKTLELLNDFFYTIQMNYSMHSLNSKKYDGEWLKKLFHKNDSYQTPIVIEPYREEGNIDVNILEDITKQRLLSTILEPHLEVNEEDNVYTKLTENKQVTHLEIKINNQKIKKIREDYNKNNKIIEYINGLIGYFSDNNLSQTYREEAELYICYKVQSIANTYAIYQSYRDKADAKEFLDILIDDKTHRTFKLHQVIYFLKYGTVTSLGKVAINDLSRNIKNIAENKSIVSSNYPFKALPLLSTIELIPPPLFDIDIILNEDIPFETLSSGEKQKIYSISSIIYHLQNIESINRGYDESIKYSNVNIILDEIELYFHPDMQRTYIYDLLEAIKNKGGFEGINALNIIMVTHSPFILSDILESNILYLGQDEEEQLEKTFGANIHTLLDNSFFMQDGLMGKFAKEKIKSLIEQLNDYKKKYKDISKKERNKQISLTKRDEIKRIISQIGEPFLKKKLFDMYFSLFDETEREVSILEREKKKLEEQIRKLQNDSN